MHRSNERDVHSTHAFVDIHTGQFVFQGKPRTTSRIQIHPTRQTVEREEEFHPASHMSDINPIPSTSDDSP